MNDIYFKIQELRRAQADRKKFLKEVREQISRDEAKLQELDNSIALIRQDIDALKRTIDALKGYSD